MKQVIIHVENQQITNSKVLRDLFTGLSDGRYLISVKSHKTRSIQQNRYYWGILIPMVLSGLRDQGWDEVRDSEDAHEIIKDLFLRKSVPNVNTGEMISFPGSTQRLSTTEFNQLIEEVQKWASEFLGIYIPDPNQQMPINY